VIAARRGRPTIPARHEAKRPSTRALSSSSAPKPLVSCAVWVAAMLAGVVSGLAVAAFTLALAGRALFDASPEQARLLLVAGPLLGLLPPAALALAADRMRTLARTLPVAAVLWLAAASFCAYWFGARPLLR
jgi:hypothetical protein